MGGSTGEVLHWRLSKRWTLAPSAVPAWKLFPFGIAKFQASVRSSHAQPKRVHREKKRLHPQHQLSLSQEDKMVAEEFFSSVFGPPLTSNTAIAKDVGIYAHSLWPTFAAKSTFKKSATPPHCLAVSNTHVFAAQHEKAYVHVYSRLRGNQEAFVAFPERIRCLTLAGNVLVLGTVEGRIMLWEVSIKSPRRH